jgi:hypothetical protein
MMRRNWLLKCSILANIAVLLYICSHVMIGNNSSGTFLIQPLNPAPQKFSVVQSQVLEGHKEVLQDVS